MSKNVKFSKKLVEQAKISGYVDHRSASEQKEHLLQICKIVQENPDLSYSLISAVYWPITAKNF